MKQKKIALINDLSGFGRCSLTVALPVLSVMKAECALLPTCLLSNHTGYPSWQMQDFSQEMDGWMDQWKAMDLKFDGICTGYLANTEQVQKVKRFLDLFAGTRPVVIVDPVMGDDGTLYPAVDASMKEAMTSLVSLADIVTPNVTEACALTGTPWKEDFTLAELEEMGSRLLALGPCKAVISGIVKDGTIADLVLEKGKSPYWNRHPLCHSPRCGTGDVFSSIIAGDALFNRDFRESVMKASGFVRKALEASDAMEVDPKEGLAFEEVLKDLL